MTANLTRIPFESQPAQVPAVPRPNCTLCGVRGAVLYGELRDRLFSAPGVWRLKQCGNPACGLIWLDPQPREEHLGLLYRDYYTHGVSEAQSSFADFAARALRYAFRLTSATVLRATVIIKQRKRFERLFVEGLEPGDLLEVGCGAGKRLPLFRGLGWRVTGQEVDAAAAEEARRTSAGEVYIGPVTDLAARGRRFDAIVMNHVLEHVLRPVDLLKTSLAMLRPGGTLICVTPNALSSGHRAHGVNWMALDPPRHLTIFAPSTLRTAASMAGACQADVTTSCANAQAFAVGSLEIASKGRYDMNRRPAWRSEIVSVLAQLRALRAFRRDPWSGDELILRCRA
jgi:2-polyprenyl-3-methyl-5-hydroxy-6-metoxy-1,4-benzoquinol methylase